METYITNFVNNYNFKYIKISNPESIEFIHNLYKYDIIDTKNDYNNEELLYIIIYYQFIKKIMN